MANMIDVKLYFNFRSPYCYLASKTLWPGLDNFAVDLLWRPVGSWDLRSTPERAANKMPIARQDVARFARRLQIPLTPPPVSTDPTLAAAVSLVAEKHGLLRPYITEVMSCEWGKGQDIGDPQVLRSISRTIGLPPEAIEEGLADPALLDQLQKNMLQAKADGVIGVPTFVIGEQVFWGQDRIDFVFEELESLGAKLGGEHHASSV